MAREAPGTLRPMPSFNFRAGVVAVVVDSAGRVLAFERTDIPGAWQLPQGGIDVGESADVAAWRELAEETGLGPDEVDLVAVHPDWTVYEFPGPRPDGDRRLGQVQRWYVFRLRDDTIEPTPDGVEFASWRWVDRRWLVDHVVEFRRPVYRSVLTSSTVPSASTAPSASTVRSVGPAAP
jgi:putative (di)nucleoside polyphosphate hydrolase